jgi:hypothetical protein
MLRIQIFPQEIDAACNRTGTLNGSEWDLNGMDQDPSSLSGKHLEQLQPGERNPSKGCKQLAKSSTIQLY